MNPSPPTYPRYDNPVEPGENSSPQLRSEDSCDEFPGRRESQGMIPLVSDAIWIRLMRECWNADWREMR